MLSAYPAALCYLANRYWPQSGAARDWLALPALWVLLEWLRGWALSGFPWLSLGYAFVDSPLVGWAPLLGVYGVTWAAAFAASALSAAGRARAAGPPALARSGGGRRDRGRADAPDAPRLDAAERRSVRRRGRAGRGIAGPEVAARQSRRDPGPLCALDQRRLGRAAHRVAGIGVARPGAGHPGLPRGPARRRARPWSGLRHRARRLSAGHHAVFQRHPGAERCRRGMVLQASPGALRRVFSRAAVHSLLDAAHESSLRGFLGGPRQPAHPERRRAEARRSPSATRTPSAALSFGFCARRRSSSTSPTMPGSGIRPRRTSTCRYPGCAPSRPGDS